MNTQRPGKGMLVIGRSERLGLGSMTEDFCRAFYPDLLITINRGMAQGFDPCEVAATHADLSSPVYLSNICLDGIQVAVAFETWYNEQFLYRLKAAGIRTVLFPMWEWTNPTEAAASDVLITLSETDDLYYAALAHYRLAWPASPAVHLDRVEEWPPQRFFHLAGNASHNREGTKEVLEACSTPDWIAALDVAATMSIRASFDLKRLVRVPPWVNVVPPVDSRQDLLRGCDCLVQPRRLGGHSLPIDEALGEGIPVVTLDLPDWAGSPGGTIRVRPVAQPNERFGRVSAPVYRAEPKELGTLLYDLAAGRIPRPERRVLPTWEKFVARWQAVVRPDASEASTPEPRPE